MPSSGFQPDQRAAPHEAGHAVAAYLLDRKLFKISIESDDLGDGIVDREFRAKTDADIVEEIAIASAGGHAGWLWGFATNCEHDERKVVRLLGEFRPTWDPAIADRISNCVAEFAPSIREPIQRLGTLLTQQRTLSGPEAETCLGDLATLGQELKARLRKISDFNIR